VYICLSHVCVCVCVFCVLFWVYVSKVCRMYLHMLCSNTYVAICIRLWRTSWSCGHARGTDDGGGDDLQESVRMEVDPEIERQRAQRAADEAKQKDEIEARMAKWLADAEAKKRAGGM